MRYLAFRPTRYLIWPAFNAKAGRFCQGPVDWFTARPQPERLYVAMAASSPAEYRLRLPLRGRSSSPTTPGRSAGRSSSPTTGPVRPWPPSTTSSGPRCAASCPTRAAGTYHRPTPGNRPAGHAGAMQRRLQPPVGIGVANRHVSASSPSRRWAPIALAATRWLRERQAERCRSASLAHRGTGPKCRPQDHPDR